MVTPVVGRPLTQVVFSEAKRNWPFVFGFGVTLTLVYKLSASLDPKGSSEVTVRKPLRAPLIVEAFSKCKLALD